MVHGVFDPQYQGAYGEKFLVGSYLVMYRSTDSLVPQGEVVQILQISGVKSGVIWTTS